MAAVSEGIKNVRVFGLLAGIAVDGEAFIDPSSVLVKWESVHTDRLHQVYVDGKFAGVTGDRRQHMMEIGVFSGLFSGSEIEVYAVLPEEGDVDLSDQLDLVGRRDRVRLSFPRNMPLPFEGKADVYSDGASGQIDYQSPVSKEAIDVWPSWQDKDGFGLSTFGACDFGYEVCGLGFGKGSFGKGEFGFDSDEAMFETSELSAGNYRFGVELTDAFGNSSPAVESQGVTVIPMVLPAEGLGVYSYDKQQDELVLTIN